MKIEIYGKGCSKCYELEGNAKMALKEAGKEAEVKHITDIKQITEKGIMFTPALVIDGRIVSEGKLLSVEEIKKAIAG